METAVCRLRVRMARCFCSLQSLSAKDTQVRRASIIYRLPNPLNNAHCRRVLVLAYSCFFLLGLRANRRGNVEHVFFHSPFQGGATSFFNRASCCAYRHIALGVPSRILRHPLVNYRRHAQRILPNGMYFAQRIFPSCIDDETSTLLPFSFR